MPVQPGGSRDGSSLPFLPSGELAVGRSDDIRYVAGQIGHEDPRFTLKPYAASVSPDRS
jgi:hypothetical protein